MDLQLFNNLIKDIRISPGINDLVDILYNDLSNSYINKFKTIDDKKTLFIFIIMYFYIYLNIPEHMKNNPNIDLKTLIKKFISELVNDPYKRQICINSFLQLETLCNSFNNLIS